MATHRPSHIQDRATIMNVIAAERSTYTKKRPWFLTFWSSDQVIWLQQVRKPRVDAATSAR